MTLSKRLADLEAKTQPDGGGLRKLTDRELGLGYVRRWSSTRVFGVAPPGLDHYPALAHAEDAPTFQHQV